MVPWVGLCLVIGHAVSLPHGATGLSVYCVYGISGSFCAFSSWCLGFVCILSLWYFPVILCLCLMVPRVCPYTVIMAFRGHSVPFPHGALGLSDYCDCGISLSFCLFLKVPWVGLCTVIVAFPGHSVSCLMVPWVCIL